MLSYRFDLPKNKAGRTLYHMIAHSECEVRSFNRPDPNPCSFCFIQELKSHECFMTLTNIIWIEYGIVQGYGILYLHLGE